eukprot:TRINITY_DN6950_c0_g1_i1.p1 TRINITY_DN6950_c0_g1~~TRINITY_DN6950_c0_g1_i1.p1  ORF type:complete len:563 (-),score=113.69 TRINITY_DN6950_c0_g1_i1:45-1679(-)
MSDNNDDNGESIHLLHNERPVSPRRESRLRSDQQQRIWTGYLVGQCSSALRTGLWWVSLAPLTLALFHHDALVLAAARILFNFGLLVFSPAAASTIEESSARNVLIWTTFARMLIYVVLMPFAWILLETHLILQEIPAFAHTLLLISFLIMIFVDGAIVAFCNTIDVDCGGAQFISEEYEAPLSEVQKNKFNSFHVACFESSIVILPPLMGTILLAFRDTVTKKDVENLALIGVFSVSFLLCGLISIFAYLCFIPALTAEVVTIEVDVNVEKPMHTAWQLWGNIVEGFRMTWQRKRLFWRLIFLGLESSFEDIILCILVPLYAVYGLGSMDSIFSSGTATAAILGSPPSYNYLAGFFWAAVLSSIGKLGSLISATCMGKCWKIPDFDEDLDGINSQDFERKAFSPLFKFVFLSGISVGCFPLAWHLWVDQNSYWPSQAVLMIGLLLFFGLSNIPKIGFQSLIPSLADSEDDQNTLSMLGFVGTFVTVCDCIVFSIFAGVFNWVGFEVALGISAAVIALNGLIELIFGPCLILPASSSGGYSQVN